MQRYKLCLFKPASRAAASSSLVNSPVHGIYPETTDDESRTETKHDNNVLMMSQVVELKGLPVVTGSWITWRSFFLGIFVHPQLFASTTFSEQFMATSCRDFIFILTFSQIDSDSLSDSL